MIRKIIFFALLLVSFQSFGQGVGLSFSYFIPNNGYFSTPVSPFSLRGIGTQFNDYISLETGGSLYLMPGMQIKDLPYESKEPFLGPAFTLMVPLQLAFTVYPQNQELSFKAGGFGFWNVWSKLNEGNIDRAIREYEGWEVANSDFSYKNKPGFGWMVGLEYIIYVNNQFGITLEVNYLLGDAPLDMKGSYTGGNSGSLETIEVEYPDAKVDFSGLEFSIGVLFN